MRDLLYTSAKDATGNLVDAQHAEKGGHFACPVCETELILRKSGKIGRGKKRPHFAHRTLTLNCTPESVLHYVFKHKLVAKFEQLIENQSELEFEWKCTYCSERHLGNLMKRTRIVKAEYDLNICRPDIALIDSSGRAFAVVEIVVTHKPEDSVVRFYKDNNIILIQIELSSDEDIYRLDYKIANPDQVAFCPNPKCEKCGQCKQLTKMTIIDADCWSCGAPMKIAVVHGAKLTGGSHIGPDRFSKKEVEFAESKGVIFNIRNSQPAKQSYLANSCPKCPAFVGNHYLFTSYFAPATYGELPSTEYTVGYHCNHR